MVARLPCLLESEEGDILVAYLRLKGLKFTHIANESNANNKQALIRGAKMKRQGVSKGYPDYCVVLPGIGLAFIELKRLHGSTTSPEQLAWIEALNSVPGVEARVCKGAALAIDFIQELLPLPSAIDTGSVF